MNRNDGDYKKYKKTNIKKTSRQRKKKRYKSTRKHKMIESNKLIDVYVSNCSKISITKKKYQNTHMMNTHIKKCREKNYL